MVQNGELYDDHDHYHDHDDDHCPHHHCHHDEEEDELESADDSPVAIRRATSYRSSPRSPRSSRHQRYGSHSKGSISGPDGYEAFENTNNKKKRKIPTSGSLSLHQGALASDMAHLGISNSDGAIDDPYNPSGLGVQGAGRGRYARKSNARNPLGPSVNGSNMRAGPSKYDQNMNAATKGKSIYRRYLTLTDNS